MKKLVVVLLSVLLLSVQISCVDEPKDKLLCNELDEAIVSFADAMYSSNLVAVVEAPTYLDTVDSHGTEHKRYTVLLNQVIRGEELEKIEVMEMVGEDGSTRLDMMEVGKEYLLLACELEEGYVVFSDRCIYEVPEYGVPVADTSPQYSLWLIEKMLGEQLEGAQEDVTVELVLNLKNKLKEWDGHYGLEYHEELEWEISSYDYNIKGIKGWEKWESPYTGGKKFVHWWASKRSEFSFEDVADFGEKGLVILTNYPIGMSSHGAGSYIYDFETDTLLPWK